MAYSIAVTVSGFTRCESLLTTIPCPGGQQTMHLRKLSLLLTCLLAVAVLISANTISVEAKGKKKKAVASSAKSKKSKTVRSKSARRTVAKRGKRSRRYAEEKYAPDPSPKIVPDRIEVLEYGSTNSSELSKLLSPPQPGSQLSNDVGTITPSRKVNIDTMRVIQIQQALASRGFYSGETSGNYDEATIDAMRRFQSTNQISATGYPTAHALKRLGLASW